MRKAWLPALTVILLLLTAGGFCAGLYGWQTRQAERNLQARETARVEAFSFLLGQALQNVGQDVALLADNIDLQDYLAQGDPAALARTSRRVQFLSHQHPAYDQIRYIDAAGREIIRVNQNGAVVPIGELQTQRNRPYFQHGIALPPRHLYISALDLNVDHGVIEHPLKPMLRFATPVFDANGQRRGIFVINYLADDIFRLLQKFAPDSHQRVRLLNSSGYWLKGATPGQEWGFMLPERKHQTLAESHPSLWHEIVQVPRGQRDLPDGIFTWQRFNPAAAIPGQTVVAGDPFLILASEVSADTRTGMFAAARHTFILVAVILVLLGGTSLWFFRASLRAQRAQQRFFTLANELLCIADFSGRFIKVNPAWTAVLGYRESDLIRVPFIEFVHPDDRARTAEEAARLTGASESLPFENRYRAKDGSYHWLLWSARALPQERIIYAVARDITRRKLAEQETERLNADLRQRTVALETANKELEAFSYTVSHDLRAPLRHIDGFVGLLQRHLAGGIDDKTRHYLNTIAHAAKQMGHLIDDLLSFSRMARAHISFSPVDHDALIDEVIRAGGYNPAIRWQRQSLPYTESDRAMLRQVWANLIDNAVKYSRHATPPRITIGSRLDPSGREIVFSISDNGVGFDMTYVDKLFGVFQRLHAATEFEGTGIGLANVRRIIGRHGGRAWAESRLGEGATIHFTLPVPDAPHPLVDHI